MIYNNQSANESAQLHDWAGFRLELYRWASSLPDDAALSRKDVSQALKGIGYGISSATLATMATRGGGPAFELWGRYPRYRWATARRWAAARVSPESTSTSEHETRKAA